MKDKICKILGTNIKKYRKLRNMTQENLAEAVGIEIKTLSLIETGRGFVSAKTLANLSEVLAIKPAKLFEYVSDEDEKELYNDIQSGLNLLKGNIIKLKALNSFIKGLI